MNGFPESPMSDAAHAAKVIISTERGNLPAMTERRCPHCKNTKPQAQFSPKGRWCRECRSVQDKQYRESHPEQISRKGKKWRKENRAYCKQYKKDRSVKANSVRRTSYQRKKQERIASRGAITHKTCSKCNTLKPLLDFTPAKTGKYGVHSQCKKCKNAYQNDRYALGARRRWKVENRKKCNQQARVWRDCHPEKVKEIKKRHYKKHERTDNEKLRDCIRGGINKTLIRGGKGGRKWQDLVGYTIVQLKKYLEKQFELGMTWDNRGTEWHIDHIIPVAAFNFETPDDIDFKRCWALTNLRPLWAPDNIRKRDKLENPFQSSLLVAA